MSQILSQLLRVQAHFRVHSPSGRDWNDDGDRPGGISVRQGLSPGRNRTRRHTQPERANSQPVAQRRTACGFPCSDAHTTSFLLDLFFSLNPSLTRFTPKPLVVEGKYRILLNVVRKSVL